MDSAAGRMLKAGDVVQINPAHDRDGFACCLLMVTEVKQWGVMGFVHIPGRDGGDAYYRVAFEHVESVGVAPWIPLDIATAEADDV